VDRALAESLEQPIRQSAEVFGPEHPPRWCCGSSSKRRRPPRTRRRGHSGWSRRRPRKTTGRGL